MVTYNRIGRGTKGSHFVWRKYFEPFSNSQKMIFGYNLHESRISPIPIINAAKKNDIYRLKKRISAEDIKLFKKLMGDCSLFPEDGDNVLMEIIGFLNNDPSHFLKTEPELRNTLLQIIDSKLDAKMLSRNQEELFTYYENNFNEIYKLLLAQNNAFFNDLYMFKDYMILGYNAGRIQKLSNFLFYKFGELTAEIAKDSLPKDQIVTLRRLLSVQLNAIDTQMEKEFPFCNICFLSINYFLTFLITQMFRTKKVQDRFLSIKNKLSEYASEQQHKEIIERVSSEAFHSLFIHGASFKVGGKLIEKEYKIIFIENTGSKGFITSDQPVINTYTTNNDEKEIGDDELEIYYPLKPNLSMLFTNKQQNTNTIFANDSDVLYYNKLIAGNAWHFIYGREKEDILEAVADIQT